MAFTGHRTEYDYPLTVSASVKFKNRVIGKAGGSFEIESPYVFNIMIQGRKGSILNDQFFTKKVLLDREGFRYLIAI